jgi:hypothetical protein
MPKPYPAPPAKASIQLYRDLGWLEVICGPYELHAYWSRYMPHRPGWRRFEIMRWSIVVGRFRVMTRKWRQQDAPDPSGRPHLSCIRGGKA